MFPSSSRSGSSTFSLILASCALLFCLFGFIHSQVDLECQTKIDVVLVVDGSSSIQSDGWQSTKKFAKALVERFNINRDNVHIGIVQFFDTRARVETDLSFNKNHILASIDAMQQGGGSTPMAAGLNAAYTMLNNHLEERKDTNKVVILLTDGQQAGDAKFQAAERLRSIGALVFAISVGSNTDQAALERLANSPASDYVLPVERFDLLNSLVNLLIEETCIEVHSLTPNFACLGDDTIVEITGRGFKNTTNGDLQCRFGDKTDIFIRAEFVSRKSMRCVLPAEAISNSTLTNGDELFVEISVNGFTYTQSRRVFSVRTCGDALNGGTVAAVILGTMAAVCCFPWLLLLLLGLLLLCCLGLLALLGLLAPALMKGAKNAGAATVKSPAGGVALLPVPPAPEAPNNNDRGYFLVGGKPVFIDYGRSGAKKVRNVHSMRMGDNFSRLGNGDVPRKINGDKYTRFEDEVEHEDQLPTLTQNKKKKFCTIL